MADNTSEFFGAYSSLHFAEKTEGRTFESLVYPESPIPIAVRSDIHDESFPAWLTKVLQHFDIYGFDAEQNQDLNKLSASGKSQAPVRGLRLVLVISFISLISCVPLPFFELLGGVPSRQ